jgi:hypothetical protein
MLKYLETVIYLLFYKSKCYNPPLGQIRPVKKSSPSSVFFTKRREGQGGH